MTDLSYTNKDGLNLYEGFDNGFDYHKDGKESGDGYAHGGYPEITGETSDYTDTSYKTGDNPDFWGNGNVWEQPSVGPEPGPVPEPYTITYKPMISMPWDIGGTSILEPDNVEGMVIDGVYSDMFSFEEGSHPIYSVTYNGTTYSNLEYIELNPQTSFKISGIGNIEGAMLRTQWAASFDETTRTSFVENNLPFALITINGYDLVAMFYDNQVPETLDITITKVTTETESCTLRLTNENLSLVNAMTFVPPITWETAVEKFDIATGKNLKVVIGEDEYLGTWTEMEGTPALSFDGYTWETAPVVVTAFISGDALIPFTARAISPDTEVTAAFIKED